MFPPDVINRNVEKNMIEIIPAIDLKNGHCVRLKQGEFTQVETYSEDPLKFAKRWQQEGAKRLHIVDLDGARTGSPQPVNLDIIRQIVRRLDIPVQLGGGIRNTEIIERMLNIGVQRVIVGTSVAQDDNIAKSMFMMYGDKVVVGIDARDGMVAISGWQEKLNEKAVDFAKRMESLGARRIIFTDISRDGMLNGPNIAALTAILHAVKLPVIASGGVGNLEHVKVLASVKEPNLEGAIVGKALYADAVSLADAIKVSL
jgi:phosphoribosylformimino-5-aminoimidazole carboxamide ribotide isomerase